MIKIKNVERYCSESIALIENYDIAVSDTTQMWECHHRKETDECLTRQQLKEYGLYYNRPASELIFLTKEQHRRIHFLGRTSPMKGRHQTESAKEKIGNASRNRVVSEETRKKLSEINKGNKHFLGKKHSEESRKKMSESRKGIKHTEESRKKISESRKGRFCGENHPMYGKHHSKESRKKMSESRKGKQIGSKNPFARGVYQLDLVTMLKIREFGCIEDACRSVGKPKSSQITQCCKGKCNSAYGYGWCYPENYIAPRKKPSDIKPLF